MENLPNLLAKLFIARKDVKARQFSDGSGYAPIKSPWTRDDLEDHLAGGKTYGHYLLNQENQCKLFAFDIDLEKSGSYPWPWDYTGWNDKNENLGEIKEFSPRDSWQDMSHEARGWLKIQLKTVAHNLCRAIRAELEIPCAVAYSGHKGLHVYGFTGLMGAKYVRAAAGLALESLGDWKASRGDNFFKCVNQDPVEGLPNLCIEVFPKQDTINEGGFGNLLRLPLGSNLKNPGDPCFFVDMSVALAELGPVDPVYALTTSNPFEAQREADS